MTRPWHRADDGEDAGEGTHTDDAVDQLLARTPEEHLRRAAQIRMGGANDVPSRLMIIEHLLWALVKQRPS